MPVPQPSFSRSVFLLPHTLKLYTWVAQRGGGYQTARLSHNESKMMYKIVAPAGPMRKKKSLWAREGGKGGHIVTHSQCH